MKENNFYIQVYDTVQKIPKGKVTTYGAIAYILEKPRASRAVGYALNHLDKTKLSKIPWHRVINAKGQISFKGDVFRAKLQKELLLKEKIIFNQDQTIDLLKYGWNWN